MPVRKYIPFVLILVIALQLGVLDSYATDKVQLVFRPDVGQKTRLLITSESDITQSEGAQQLSMKHVKVTGLEFEVQEKNSEGTALIGVTYVSFREKSSSPMGEMKYDSTNPETFQDNPFATTYAALIGETVVTEVSRTGEITKVADVDGMLDAMAGKILAAEERKSKGQKTDKQRKAQVKQMLKTHPMFHEVAIKELLHYVFVPFSSKPIGKSESWKSKIVLPSFPLPTETEVTYTIKESKKKTTLLAIKANRRLNTAGMVVNTSCNGTAEVDKSSGWLTYRKIDIQVEGKSKTKRGAKQDTGTKMSIKTTVTVEPVKDSGLPQVNPTTDVPNKQSGQKKRMPIYDPNAIADKQIAEALTKAKKENKRVILMYGGNWCGWCYKLHDCFEKNDNIKTLFHESYELVLVDIKSNEALPQKYDAKPDGYPYLTILDADGQVLVNQSTVPLEEGRKHNPGKVFEFLDKWK